MDTLNTHFESSAFTLDRFSWLLLLLYTFFATVFALGVYISETLLALFAFPAVVVLVQQLGFSLPSSGHVHVNADGIFWNNTHLVARDNILGVVRADTVITLRTGAPSHRLLRFNAPDQQSAETFVRALGSDAERSALTLRLGSPFTRLSSDVYIPLVAGAAVGALGSVVWALIHVTDAGARLPFFVVASLLVALLVMAFAPTRVTLGSDGVLVRWLGRQRWLPWHDVARVEKTPERDELMLTTHTGHEFALPTELPLSLGDPDTKPELAHRVEALVRAANDAQRHPVARRLARGERSVRTWIADLRALTQAAPGYRAQPVTRGELLAVLHDTNAWEQLRIAAAVALATEGEREVVSQQAETIASPRVRVVLDEIAARSDDDEALEAALEAAEIARRSGR
jgi:hypothetical protein